MKTARVAHDGAVHDATPHAEGLRLADGRVLAEDAVVWLPPFEPGTIIALGPELRRPREGAVEGTRQHGPGGAARVPQGPGTLIGPSRLQRAVRPGGVHALRVRARGRDRAHREEA